ncbi:hypothetical protein OE88DRAFT_1036735 [Heliocybe sulcata]|uniref:Uncharacterized protein n=1 Tax=Heliocybe sulcata TaxID=5364 RepID=A0A5C3MP55_9AGAM|nr:hypothetical protein OE88DRAFT_1036735 [Heliocybe sulcata]
MATFLTLRSPERDPAVAKCYCGSRINFTSRETGISYCSSQCADRESFALKNGSKPFSRPQRLPPARRHTEPMFNAEPVYATGLSVIFAKQREAQLRAAAGASPTHGASSIPATRPYSPRRADTFAALNPTPSSKPTLHVSTSNIEPAPRPALSTLSNGLAPPPHDSRHSRPVPPNADKPLDLASWLGESKRETVERKPVSQASEPLDLGRWAGPRTSKRDDSDHIAQSILSPVSDRTEPLSNIDERLDFSKSGGGEPPMINVTSPIHSPIPRVFTPPERTVLGDPSLGNANPIVPLDLLSWVGVKTSEGAVWNPTEQQQPSLRVVTPDAEAALRAPTPSRTRPALTKTASMNDATSPQRSKPAIHRLVTDSVLGGLRVR